MMYFIDVLQSFAIEDLESLIISMRHADLIIIKRHPLSGDMVSLLCHKREEVPDGIVCRR